MAKARAVLAETLKYGATLTLLALLLSAALVGSGGFVSAQTATPSPVQVKWEVETPPTEGRVGLRIIIPRLKLTNSGTQPWASSGANEYKIGYHWFYGYGAAIPKDGPNGYQEARANLPQDIPSGGGVIYPNFQVFVPKEPGDYVLHIDLVQPQQNDTWLQSKGVQDVALKISVKAGDGTAPVVQLAKLPVYTNSTAFQVNWSGKDEDGGTGLAGYDLQYKTSSDTDWTSWLSGTTLTSALFQGENGKVYQFRIRASDKSGNVGNYSTNGDIFTRVDSLPPSSGVNTLPPTSPSTFLVRWSSFDSVDGPNTALFDVQYREGEGVWTDWIVGTPGTAGLFQGQPGKSYSFRVRALDYAGNQSEYPSTTQAKTTTSAALDSVYAPQTVPATTPAAGPTTLIFPLASKNGDAGSGTMGFVISNPTDQPADVFIRFDNYAGIPVTKTVNNQTVPIDNNEAIATNRVVTQLETIPAKSSKTVWAGNLYLPIYNGWATIVSGAPVQAAAVRLAADGKIVQYTPARAATKLYLPVVRKLEATNSTIIALVNPNPVPVAVDITYYNEAGGTLFTERRELGRLASTRFTLAGLRTSDPNLRFNGSAVISAPTSIAATVENYLEDGTVATYPAQSAPAPTIAPTNVYKNVDGYTTSLLVQNTSNAVVQAKVEYLDANGQVVGTLNQQLQPNGRFVAWQGALQTETFSGKVRVTATGGNVVGVIIGAGPGLKDKAFP